MEENKCDFWYLETHGAKANSAWNEKAAERQHNVGRKKLLADFIDGKACRYQGVWE